MSLSHKSAIRPILHQGGFFVSNLENDFLQITFVRQSKTQYVQPNYSAYEIPPVKQSPAIRWGLLLTINPAKQ